MGQVALIPGHAGYRAGKDGSIESAWRMKGTGRARTPSKYISNTWRKLKGWPDPKKGNRRFYRIRRDDGTIRQVAGATLVMEAFVGPIPAGFECCHKNDDATDDRFSNLKLGTRADNAKDMVRNGKSCKGEKNPSAKLNEDKVRYILGSSASNRDLADEFDVSTDLIGLVRRRKVWGHVV